MIALNPIYNHLLGQNLQSTHLELLEEPVEVDFSLTERTWADTATTVALFLLKIVLFPWALYEAVRWCFQRLVMIGLYPAQSWLVKKCFYTPFRTENLDQKRVHEAERLTERGYIVRHVKLEKDGTRFSGLLVGKPETINNGKWVLQAAGNGGTAEGTACVAKKYHEVGYNTLLVNNPGVGRSGGIATPETMGECQRTAIPYLKTALKADHIVLAGCSLGGASIGQAIMQYDFAERETNFLVVRQVAFEKASEIVAHYSPALYVPSCLAKYLVTWCCEMDNLEASKKLAQQNIREIIIQGTRDEVVPAETTLMLGLLREGVENVEILRNKEFDVLPDADHNDMDQILDATIRHIRGWEARLELMAIAE